VPRDWPATLPLVLPGQAPGRLAEAIAPPSFGAQRDSNIARRQGVVQAINYQSPQNFPITVDVQLGGSGITIPEVQFLSSYAPVVGDVVWVDLKGTDPLVIGSCQAHIWNAPTFQGTWTNYGGGFMPARYGRDSYNNVFVIGSIASGTINTTAFTLPVGYRPYQRLTIAGLDYNSAHCRIDLYTDGTVVPTTGDNRYISINAYFPADLY